MEASHFLPHPRGVTHRAVAVPEDLKFIMSVLFRQHLSSLGTKDNEDKHIVVDLFHAFYSISHYIIQDWGNIKQ